MNTNSTAKTKNSIKSLLNEAFNSKLFPFLLAAVIIICYYTSLDIVAIYFVAILGILIFTLSDDLNPFITLLLFMNVIVSYKHSPSAMAGGSSYYYQPHILWQVAILIALLLLSGVFRLIKTFREHKFKPTPVLYGLCALSVAFLLNGLFCSSYTFMNLAYGAVQAVIYLGIFAVFKDNVKVDKAAFEKIALSFFALSILLIIELAVSYLTYDHVFWASGEIDRDTLSYGWGVYNTMGMLLVLCVPSVMYLAGIYKHGYLFTAHSVLIAAACLLTTSKQSVLGLIVAYPVGLICLFIKSRKRLGSIIVLAVAAIIAVIIVGVFRDKFIVLMTQAFTSVFQNGEFYASNRAMIYNMGFNHFESAPLFGVGFYSPGLHATMQNVSGLDAMPYFYHNTLLQMAASCGIIGFAIYVVHRCQTVISFLNNLTVERAIIGVTILALLVLSLLDVHMFDILPTMTYSSLLAVLVASEKGKPQKPVKPKFIIKM